MYGKVQVNRLFEVACFCGGTNPKVLPIFGYSHVAVSLLTHLIAKWPVDGV
jgi:hypothetical protein